ncbi:MAG: hypothetical protein E6H58_09225 [Betaproteobacteria bacterium]|nr:MAG: hypothetical protein E6H58_09225 [Betaproteobacteria bacterium]
MWRLARSRARRCRRWQHQRRRRDRSPQRGPCRRRPHCRSPRRPARRRWRRRPMCAVRPAPARRCRPAVPPALGPEPACSTPRCRIR